MRTKLNISIVLALLFVLFAIKPNTAHAEVLNTPPASVQYTSHVSGTGWISYVGSGTSGTPSQENHWKPFD